MDVPCAHPPCIQGDHLFFNPGDVTLVFWYQLWLELPIPVPGHVNLEFPILALEVFRGMPVAFVVRLQIPFVVFLIAEGCIQLSLHEFLQDILETVPEQGIDIGDAV